MKLLRLVVAGALSALIGGLGWILPAAAQQPAARPHIVYIVAREAVPALFLTEALGVVKEV